MFFDKDCFLFFRSKNGELLMSRFPNLYCALSFLTFSFMFDTDFWYIKDVNGRLVARYATYTGV